MTDANSAASTQTSRVIQAPRDALYRAFTDPHALAVWLPPEDMTGTVYVFDARVGGGYQMSLFYLASEQVYRGKTAEREDRFTTRFVELTPPARIVQVVAFDSADPAFAGEMTMVVTLSATYGRVTLVLVDKAGEERFYLLCRETTISAPRLIRAWGRRRWIEHTFRTLKHLLATEACQVQTEEAYYGYLVLRLLAGLVHFYTARFCVQGRVTMEAIVFSLKHHWRFLSSDPLELYALSWDLSLEAV